MADLKEEMLSNKNKVTYATQMQCKLTHAIDYHIFKRLLEQLLDPLNYRTTIFGISSNKGKGKLRKFG